MRRFRWLAALALLAALGAVSIVQMPATTHPLPASIVSPRGEVPHAMRQGGAMAVASYQAALLDPQLLAQVPCTCGCMGVLGHRNNRDCYIEAVYADGSVAFTTHGVFCAVCQAITRDTLVGHSLGLTGEQLFQMILARYSGQGM